MMSSSNSRKFKFSRKRKRGKNLMADKKKSVKRKLVEAGGWTVAKRATKSIPYVGSLMAIGLVGYDIKKKGVVKGILNSGIDAIPFVGLAKNAVELFTGDFFPDKPEKKS
jgi:hypothetical protein